MKKKYLKKEKNLIDWLKNVINKAQKKIKNKKNIINNFKKNWCRKKWRIEKEVND